MFRNKLTAIKCTPHYARPLCTVNLSAATDYFEEHLATLLKNVEVKAQTVDCLKNRRRKSIFETVAPPKRRHLVVSEEDNGIIPQQACPSRQFINGLHNSSSCNCDVKGTPMGPHSTLSSLSHIGNGK